MSDNKQPVIKGQNPQVTVIGNSHVQNGAQPQKTTTTSQTGNKPPASK
jgi:hypothetical protein